VKLSSFLAQTGIPYRLKTSSSEDTYSFEFYWEKRFRFSLELRCDPADSVQEALLFDANGSFLGNAVDLQNFPRFDYNINMEMPTLGGKQCWYDLIVLYGYHLQYNHFFKYYRLLDPQNFRATWGSYAQCLGKFLEGVYELQLKPQHSHIVLLIHGYLRAKESMKEMGCALEPDYDVLLLNYPSTRQSIDVHSSNLAQIVSHLNRYSEISFVTHSLGGIIVRHFLQTCKDPRIQNLVMLAPPNQGSELAEKVYLKTNKMPFLRKIFGGIAYDLRVSHPQFQTLEQPWCRTGIIAAIQGNAKGYNPLLEGEDDGIVRLEETKLEGKAHCAYRGIHTFMMMQKSVQEETRHFLKYGNFLSNP
jgi:hypothetical protein